MSLILATLLFGALAEARDPSDTAIRQPSRGDTVRLNFPVDSSLMTWVNFFAELRQINFVIPNRSELEAVELTILSTQDVSPDAAWEAFLSALAVEGYTLAFTGQTAKIVKVETIHAGRLGTGRPADSDAWLTQLFTVETARVEDLSELFSSLMGPGTKIIPHPTTNTLIVTGTAASLRTVHGLLQGLDVPKPELTVESYPLEFSDPGEVRQLIEQVYGDDPRYQIQVFDAPDR